MKFRAVAGIAFAAMLSVVPASAQAQFTTYTSLAAYLAAISGPATDTYNDLPLGDQGGPQLDRMVGAYSYRATSGPFYNVGSVADIWLSTNSAGESITFSNFSSTVRGVGGYLFSTDPVGNPINTSTMRVSYTNAGGTFYTDLTNPTPTSFFGVVSNSAVTSFVVTADRESWTTVNDLVLGGAPSSVVPEPSTYALVAAGLALMSIASKRRRSAAKQVA